MAENCAKIQWLEGREYTSIINSKCIWQSEFYHLFFVVLFSFQTIDLWLEVDSALHFNKNCVEISI